MADSAGLSEIASLSRRRYAEILAGSGSAVPWWTAVVITASSERQAELYSEEIAGRRRRGGLPADTLFLSVPDPGGQRIGSGGATLNALRALAEASFLRAGAGSLDRWWESQRVLVIHSGGDARRLPQYSLLGKLFASLPVQTAWGEPSTVFDEYLTLSTLWVERLASGAVIASGDVVLTFDSSGLQWDRPGVSGVAIRQPMAVGSGHGVYVTDAEGRIYAFLQKPTAAEVRAAGGLLEGHRVAVDTGLIRFDPDLCARLTELAGVQRAGDRWAVGDGILRDTDEGPPVIDLYRHFTFALTGQWEPEAGDERHWQELAGLLSGRAFWCDLVEGDFTHLGTTALFRQLLTEETSFSSLHKAQQRLGRVAPPGVRSSGVIVDSVLAAGSELGPGAVAIECHLASPLRAARGAVAHGLADVDDVAEVPENTVAHQIPVLLPNRRRGASIRVYGVNDDPREPLARGGAMWFGRPLLEVLEAIGLDPEEVWPGVDAQERALWNAELFPVTTPAEAWQCAQWLMGLAADYTPQHWRGEARVSLATSTRWVDAEGLSEAHSRRRAASWQRGAVSMAESGTDIRPLVAQAPGIAALAAVGRELARRAAEVAGQSPTEAASRAFKASVFLAQAGLVEEAERARTDAFGHVGGAVHRGVEARDMMVTEGGWRHEEVDVSAPVRVDFGGGWSDTPPFCIDWGGTVLNAALALEGEYPVRTRIRRIDDPMVRCVAGDDGGRVVEWRQAEQLRAEAKPGSPFAVPSVALQMTGMLESDRSLAEVLERFGGGLEFRTTVDVPMGSGLGTSSILGATVIRALAEMLGIALSDESLLDQVSALEQRMTTGGGWQDQVGGVLPGMKLVTSRPGVRQRLRVAPVQWSADRQQEFEARFILHYTGIVRVAKDLLTEVVGGYLAREVGKVQVLHNIKTLAVEMAHAMAEGDWEYLGSLMDRHWKMNKVLDPHTTNAAIDACLRDIRPYLWGAKLAGAGGGGFLMLLARDPDAAGELRAHLAARDGRGRPYEYTIADAGLNVKVEG